MTAIVHAARRGFRRVVTIPAASRWPEQDASGTAMNLPHYAWAHIANRAAPGSGNDVQVSFTGPLNTVDKPDRIVPAGQWMTEQIAGPGDDLATGLHLVNLGAAAADVVVILSKNPIHYDLGNIYPTGTAGGVDVTDRAARLVGAVRVQDGFGNAINGVGWSGDGTGTNVVGLGTTSALQAYNGSTWDRVRTPNVFKQLSLAGGAVGWVPASGKKYRLQGLMAVLRNTSAVAAAGPWSFTISDSGGATYLAIGAYLPGASIATPGAPFIQSGWLSLGNGILSPTANNTLNVNFSAALTAGALDLLLAGTEE